MWVVCCELCRETLVSRSAESWRRRGGELSERRAWPEDGVVPCAACRKTLPHELHGRAEAIDGAKAMRLVGFVFAMRRCCTGGIAGFLARKELARVLGSCAASCAVRPS